MAIPGFQTLMLPMLEALADGQVRRVIPEVSDILAVRLGLTETDLAEMLPSGAMSTFVDRAHWAATYMSKVRLFDRPKRGHVVITQRGLDIVADRPAKMDIPFLMRYPEFEVFRAKRKSVEDGAITDGVGAAEEENPEEALYRAYGSWRTTVETDLLERLQSESFPWQSFERLVVDLLHEMGYGGSDEDRRRVTKMTGDDGIDGRALARYMYEHGIGVRTRRTLDVKGVDEVYFEASPDPGLRQNRRRHQPMRVMPSI